MVGEVEAAIDPDAVLAHGDRDYWRVFGQGVGGDWSDGHCEGEGEGEGERQVTGRTDGCVWMGTAATDGMCGGVLQQPPRQGFRAVCQPAAPLTLAPSPFCPFLPLRHSSAIAQPDAFPACSRPRSLARPRPRSHPIYSNIIIILLYILSASIPHLFVYLFVCPSVRPSVCLCARVRPVSVFT